MKYNGSHYMSRYSMGGRQAIMRHANFQHKQSPSPSYSSNSSRSPHKLRIVKFKIPHDEQHFRIGTPSLDRSSTWEMVKTFLPHETQEVEPANEQEAHVLKAFGLKPDELLNIPPLKYLPSPFAYHSAVNGDKSYISLPRLSVSKVLTDAWCELKSYYEIYAGLPCLSPLARMKAGTKYHATLELAEHPKHEAISLRAQLKLLLANHSEEVIKELTKTKAAYLFAHGWTDQTVFRSICASYTKVARELFVHGFLDLDNELLVTEASKLHKAVLVNGIADIVRIDTFNAEESFDDAESTESFSKEIPQFGRSEVLDLSVELAKAKDIMAELAETHSLHMRDVKTRLLNSIPSQMLAVNGAKIQCMYYAVFLHNLSRDAEFAYESCVENITRRRIDPDEPLSIALATELLVVNFRTVALDYVRLAKGQAIGFPKFDTYTPQTKEYSLSQFLTEKDFRTLIQIHYGDELDITGFDLAPLFTQWEIPLTLRYFSARAGQAFNIYAAFKPASVCVEYHNPQSHQIIARKHYPFVMSEIQNAITQTSTFWNGRRRPVPIDNPSACSFCTFKKRCSAINSGNAPETARLIQDLQE